MNTQNNPIITEINIQCRGRWFNPRIIGLSRTSLENVSPGSPRNPGSRGPDGEVFSPSDSRGVKRGDPISHSLSQSASEHRSPGRCSTAGIARHRRPTKMTSREVFRFGGERDRAGRTDRCDDGEKPDEDVRFPREIGLVSHTVCITPAPRGYEIRRDEERCVLSPRGIAPDDHRQRALRSLCPIDFDGYRVLCPRRKARRLHPSPSSRLPAPPPPPLRLEDNGPSG